MVYNYGIPLKVWIRWVGKWKESNKFQSNPCFSSTKHWTVFFTGDNQKPPVGKTTHCSTNKRPRPARSPPSGQLMSLHTYGWWWMLSLYLIIFIISYNKLCLSPPQHVPTHTINRGVPLVQGTSDFHSFFSLILWHGLQIISSQVNPSVWARLKV